MPENIKSIMEHKNFSFNDSRADDLYYSLFEFLTEYIDRTGSSVSEVIGVLEWTKNSIIVENTEYTEE